MLNIGPLFCPANDPKQLKVSERNEKLAYHHYRDLLGRLPDAAGLANFKKLDQATQLFDILTSAEAQARYTARYGDPIAAIYLLMLGRDPLPSEVAAGLPGVKTMLASYEFRADYALTIGRRFLGRSLDTLSELPNIVAAAPTLEDIALIIAGKGAQPGQSEWQNRFGGSGPLMIRQAYNDMLYRDFDVPGATSWAHAVGCSIPTFSPPTTLNQQHADSQSETSGCVTPTSIIALHNDSLQDGVSNGWISLDMGKTWASLTVPWAFDGAGDVVALYGAVSKKTYVLTCAMTAPWPCLYLYESTDDGRTWAHPINLLESYKSQLAGFADKPDMTEDLEGNLIVTFTWFPSFALDPDNQPAFMSVLPGVEGSTVGPNAEPLTILPLHKMRPDVHSYRLAGPNPNDFQGIWHYDRATDQIRIVSVSGQATGSAPVVLPDGTRRVYWTQSGPQSYAESKDGGDTWQQIPPMSGESNPLQPPLPRSLGFPFRSNPFPQPLLVNGAVYNLFAYLENQPGAVPGIYWGNATWPYSTWPAPNAVRISGPLPACQPCWEWDGHNTILAAWYEQQPDGQLHRIACKAVVMGTSINWDTPYTLFNCGKPVLLFDTRVAPTYGIGDYDWCEAVSQGSFVLLSCTSLASMTQDVRSDLITP